MHLIRKYLDNLKNILTRLAGYSPMPIIRKYLDNIKKVFAQPLGHSPKQYIRNFLDNLDKVLIRLAGLSPIQLIRKYIKPITLVLTILLLLTNLAVILFWIRPALASQQMPTTTSTSTFLPSPQLTLTPSSIPLPSPLPTFTLTSEPILPQVTETQAAPTLPPEEVARKEHLQEEGIFILSMRDGDFNHLFAYNPQYIPLTRLTNGQWDDIHPSLNPEGSRLAFSSRRNGYWDIFIMDLTSGEISRLTDTPGYDGYPTWSPDSQWIAYETYIDNNLEIAIRSTLDPLSEPIRLTNEPGEDYSPEWSPLGRQIAFVSNRSGNEDIWLARLDEVDERFENVSRSAGSREFHPSWSPDGSFLAMSSDSGGDLEIRIWDSRNPEKIPVQFKYGNWPTWSPKGDALLTLVQSANRNGITAYNTKDSRMIFPLTFMPGPIQGLDWSAGDAPLLIQALSPLPDATAPSSPLWTTVLTTNPSPPAGRFGVVPLLDITAPYAFLHDSADESFNAMRQQVALECGWDYLANLENAFLPINEPPIPGMVENWLNTGRAIAVNALPINAGWMLLKREEFSGQTFWRIYLRARYQDGSQGVPLKSKIWDMESRSSGNAQYFEAGGHSEDVPSGYWVDFTEIAARYGWERSPSLVNWRSYLPSARYNLYTFDEGLDWSSAMAEVYPVEALSTPTFRPTITTTATRTPYRKIPTVTPTPGPATPTFRPTFTEQP